MTGSQWFGCAIVSACFIALAVTFGIGCATHNWGPLGMCAFLVFVVPIWGAAAYGKKTPPVRYCPRCGTHHQLPKGPNCPR